MSFKYNYEGEQWNNNNNTTICKAP